MATLLSGNELPDNRILYSGMNDIRNEERSYACDLCSGHMNALGFLRDKAFCLEQNKMPDLGFPQRQYRPWSAIDT
jgi:hypothetical protein